VEIFDRVKTAFAVMAGQLRAPSAWSNHRYGTKSGHIFDGSKFRGANIYPSKWDFDHEALRDASRMAYWDSTQARAIIGRMVDNVVGTGLALESSPIWSLIGKHGKTDEELHQLARDIELRFDLWASSHEPDASGRMTLYELQAFEFLNRLRDGETFNVLRYSGDPTRMSPLAIQALLPEQIMTPFDKLTLEATKTSGRRIESGIELDEYGRELAIHIYDEYTRTSKRMPFSGETRRFVLHPVNADTLGAVRGTPLLAPLVHELQKITDYTVAEIEAAVLNAVLAVWIKPGPDAKASQALNGIQTRNGQKADPAAPSGTGASESSFDKPGLIVQTLKAGEELESFDTKRPNANFGEFVRQIERSLAASVGEPVSILNMEFTKSYSASRAELLLFWCKVEIERAKTASQFLGPIFESWFVEEVKAGRIKASNFNDSPVIRRAWLACSWNGDKLPSLDPLKEANADGVRIEQGTTTRERVAMETNGSDAMENIRRLKIENEMLAEANEPLMKAAAPVAAPAADQAADEGDEEEQKDDGEEKA